MDNSNYQLDKIIEEMKRSLRRIKTILQRETISTMNDNSNNNDDYGVNQKHDYWNEEEDVDIHDRYLTYETQYYRDNREDFDIFDDDSTE